MGEFECLNTCMGRVSRQFCTCKALKEQQPPTQEVTQGLRQWDHEKPNRVQLVWFIQLSPVCVQLIDFIEAREVRSEWVPVSLSGPGGPQHSRPLQWLIKTPALSHERERERGRERERRRGAFLSNSSGFPEISHWAFVRSTRAHKRQHLPSQSFSGQKNPAFTRLKVLFAIFY